MVDYLDELCRSAARRVADGYYEEARGVEHDPISLRERIERCSRNAVITEIKPASPSLGVIRQVMDHRLVAEAMVRGGATGLSVLTEPERFGGSLEAISLIRESVSLPILMKDFVVDERQIRSARRIGADAVLLIMSVFKRGYASLSLRDAIELAHSLGLEVLLETQRREELVEALGLEADLIGVNSRDLSSLRQDLGIFEETVSGLELHGRILVAESGIERPDQIRRLKDLGYRAFLIGTAIMKSSDIEAKVRELVEG